MPIVAVVITGRQETLMVLVGDQPEVFPVLVLTRCARNAYVPDPLSGVNVAERAVTPVFHGTNEAEPGRLISTSKLKYGTVATDDQVIVNEVDLVPLAGLAPIGTLTVPVIPLSSRDL